MLICRPKGNIEIILVHLKLSSNFYSRILFFDIFILSYFLVIYYYNCSYIQWNTDLRTRNIRNETAGTWSWHFTYIHC